jgi:Protein of unknown function (DUF3604)
MNAKPMLGALPVRLAVALVVAVGVAGAAVMWRWSGAGALVEPLRPVAVQAQDGLPVNLPEIFEPDCPALPGPHGNDPDKQVFWGELHLHTQYSLDAYSFGTRTTPAEAYLYAKQNGYSLQINEGTAGTPGPSLTQARPLDFVAVTDHAEWLSVVEGCTNPGSGMYRTRQCREVRSLNEETQEGIFPERMGALLTELCLERTPNNPLDTLACVAQQRSAWVEMQRAARNAYRKCRFTAFVAYEWSDQDPLRGQTQPAIGGPLTNHRNVIFAGQRVPLFPLDSVNYPDPPSLWTGLDRWCRDLCRAVTIPHNSNLSDGISLKLWDSSQRGRRQQRQYQVAAEIYQHKGASECYYNPNGNSPETDCAFEQLDTTLEDTPIAPHSFVRAGLALGLADSLASQQQNALKLGFVGGTDGHNGAPGNVDDAGWKGHDAREDNTPRKRLLPEQVAGRPPKPARTDWGPGGITAVWAQENSRQSIFAAIQRRETYATSGPRMKVRVLQTSNPSGCTDPSYPGSLLRPPAGTPGAVPMGGTFFPANLNGDPVPTFAIEVWGDQAAQALTRLAPGGRGRAEIATVQVIKIRASVVNGQVDTATDAPVDVVVTDLLQSAHFDRTTGGCLLWRDTSFVPNESALYYVRVLQEDTWRWSYHDCVALAATPEGIARGLTESTCAADPRNVVQERAWTSPIWYEPVVLPAAAGN